MRSSTEGQTFRRPWWRRSRSVGWMATAVTAGVLAISATAYGIGSHGGPLGPSPSQGHPTAAAGGGDALTPTDPVPSPSASGLAALGPAARAKASARPSAGTTGRGASGCPVAGGTSGCPSGPPIEADSGKRWKLSFNEDFTGSDYDHSRLTPCFDWNTGDCTASFNHGRERYEPGQVKVSSGTAKLVAAPRPAVSNSACQNGTCTYKAGLLSTARPRASAGANYLYRFTYGYVEARMKFPATRGFFTAFWMLPADPSYNYRSEIDILELLGDDPSTMYMTYHYNNRSQSYAGNTGKHNNGACAVTDYSKGFVLMGLDWRADHIAWYINGKKCAQFSNASQIESGPMQLILHMMVDNDWQRQWNVGLTDPTLTRQLEVDYLRVYQQVAS
jgi:hypothetical protein